MRDVAAEAGVTPVVVSRVLHNKAQAVRVSDKTAERVREAAIKLGYNCNVWARNFRSQETFTIGVLHGVGFSRPMFDRGSRYFASLMDGIVEGAFRHGYSVNLCPRLLGQHPESAISDGRFDGLVWYSNNYTAENRAMLLQCPVPLVLIHAPEQMFEGKFSTVICDNHQGIGLAIEHLVHLGHRQISFIYEGDQPSLESQIRIEAFKRQMAERSLPVSETSILRTGWGGEGLDEYLSSRPLHTAIIANNEWLASEILLRAPRLGVRVPEDISVVGFDSTAYCNELQPKLTAIFQPLVALGNSAIDLLVDTIKSDAPTPRHLVIPCGFDIRNSTQPINSE